MVSRLLEGDRLLTSGEVGKLFACNYKTVGRWVREGRLVCIRTPGGQMRFRRSEVYALLAQLSERAGTQT